MPTGWLPPGALLALALLAPPLTAAVRVNGSTMVNPVVVEAAAALGSERGMAIQTDTLGGSAGGIAAVPDGRAEVAMSSRPLLASDRERYSALDPRSTETIEELILGLKSRHTIVLVTDHLGCLCLRDGAGEVLDSACCADLFSDPRCRDVVRYLEGE